MTLTISRRNWIAYVAIDVALFLIASFTAKNAHDPGTFSNIAWGGFMIGAAALIALAVVTLIRRRR
jgi:MYXO-CTERM domain-containing protein